jgi:GGDEF domain-containing protein
MGWLPSRAAGQQASDSDVGADALTGVTQRIWIYLRDSDSPCRWGSEELIILMPHSDLDLPDRGKAPRPARR